MQGGGYETIRFHRTYVVRRLQRFSHISVSGKDYGTPCINEAMEVRMIFEYKKEA